MSFKSLPLLLLSILFFGCSHADETVSQSHKDETEVEIDSSEYYWKAYEPLRAYSANYFDSLNKISHFNGSYALSIAGNKVAEGHLGLATPKRDSLGQNHRFQLASGTKPFTALAIMQLYEKGKLHLSDTVGKYIPNFPYYGITIKNLLSHYGGLSEYPYFTDFVADSLDYIDNKWVVNYMMDSIPDYYYRPGQKHDYSNTGYMLLAHLIEKISGFSYHDYLKQKIFEPAGMTRSFVYYPGALEKEDSLAWGMIRKNLYRSGNEYLNGVYGDKGVYATSSDMLAFSKALDNNILLSDSLRKLMETPVFIDKRKRKAYALGWRVLYPDTDSTLTFHTGWWQGSRSYFIRDIKRKRTLIVLDNLKYGPFLDVMQLMKIFDKGTKANKDAMQPLSKKEHQKLETKQQIH